MEVPRIWNPRRENCFPGCCIVNSEISIGKIIANKLQVCDRMSSLAQIRHVNFIDYLFDGKNGIDF